MICGLSLLYYGTLATNWIAVLNIVCVVTACDDDFSIKFTQEKVMTACEYVYMCAY